MGASPELLDFNNFLRGKSDTLGNVKDPTKTEGPPPPATKLLADEKHVDEPITVDKISANQQLRLQNQLAKASVHNFGWDGSKPRFSLPVMFSKESTDVLPVKKEEITPEAPASFKLTFDHVQQCKPKNRGWFLIPGGVMQSKEVYFFAHFDELSTLC
jgi:hypothetical protein